MMYDDYGPLGFKIKVKGRKLCRFLTRAYKQLNFLKQRGRELSCLNMHYVSHQLVSELDTENTNVHLVV